MTSRIRAAINGDRDLQQELAPLDQQFGTKGKEAIAEALKSKDVGDGCNALMHAALLGNERSFTSAVVVIKQRVSEPRTHSPNSVGRWGKNEARTTHSSREPRKKWSPALLPTPRDSCLS